MAAEAIPEALRPVFNDLRNELRSQCPGLENELYLLTDGQDAVGHPVTQKEAELYNRYYIRFEGSFNRAYKQLKDSQTNRACQFIEANPEAARPTLTLADALKIQRFAKRTPITEPRPSGSASDDILQHFSPADQADIREEAQELGVSINYLVAVAAQYARRTVYDQLAKNETNPIQAGLRR